MFKTFILVGASAGLGGFAGDKLHGFVSPHLPPSVNSPAVSTGVKLGLQAASGVAIYAVLRSLVGG
jgi:hypothetical protein